MCTVKGDKDIDHIADIKPDKEKGGIKVYKFNGTTSHLRSLKRYVDFMMNKGIMTSAVRLEDKKLNIEDILAEKNIPETLLSDIGYQKENNSNDNLRKLLSRSEGTNIRQKDLKASGKRVSFYQVIIQQEELQVEVKENKVKKPVTFEDVTVPSYSFFLIRFSYEKAKIPNIPEGRRPLKPSVASLPNSARVLMILEDICK